jgi:dihydroorotate dehydrogenase (NAD+) catalytic subunit
LAIDERTRRVVLGAGGGGLSGPALHSVALRAVFDCASAYPEAAIVGVGGIADGAGALRMLLAGASAVQVGTATLADPRAPQRVLAELCRILEGDGTASLADVVGAALLEHLESASRSHRDRTEIAPRSQREGHTS